MKRGRVKASQERALYNVPRAQAGSLRRVTLHTLARGKKHGQN